MRSRESDGYTFKGVTMFEMLGWWLRDEVSPFRNLAHSKFGAWGARGRTVVLQLLTYLVILEVCRYLMRGRFSLFAKQSPLKRRLHFFFYQQNKELTEAAALYPTTHITQKKLFQSKKEQHHVICCRLAGSADHQSSENQQQQSSSSLLSNSAAISSSAGGGTLSAQ